MTRIPLHKLQIPETANDYIRETMNSGHLEAGGPFTTKCEDWLQIHLETHRALLTNSGSTALEAAALVLDIQPGDEIIMPAWTFPSTANAFVLRDAIPVFVDIRPDTLNLDEQQIEDAITPRTRAITVVHYAGVACEMDPIMMIARKHGLRVIEDAAQGFLAKYRGQYLGTFGDLGVLSFHKTKNSGCGEGGALLLNDPNLIKSAETIRDKGTNRQAWQRNETLWYEWTTTGIGAAPTEISSAILLAQLENAENEKKERIWAWHEYLKKLQNQEKLTLPIIPDYCEMNGHIFAVQTESSAQAEHIISETAKSGIEIAKHYYPLHQTKASAALTRSSQKLYVTERSAPILLRLPLWPGMDEITINEVLNTLIKTIHAHQYNNIIS